jgi:hypothetical protein
MSPPAAVVASCVAPRAFLCVVAFLVAIVARQGPNVLGAGGAGVLNDCYFGHINIHGDNPI